ncbi:hypothetical protein RCG17_00420 [Neobacillus sp. PS3-12]|jgi:hypothetical protein|uniref:hypothetical protein n=1 Tax=Neobacillus sp. PS3-12 TaxID=3070677 RepID=UPI0027E1C7E7|nr:hypothetical protein [Neobacillus sp. PS3-12]WML53220.1 hypothetical protein RCG17_00420 [Neobacillus sp. PS3-12]
MLPSDILNRVKTSLKKDFGENFSHQELDAQIEAMTKAEIMDKYFNTFEEKIDHSVVFRFIQSIFHFDLDNKPVNTEKDLSSAVIDSFLYEEEEKITGAKIRSIINQIFGINLDAISALDGAKISLYSKDQWVLQHDKDLFVVHTGNDDIDVRIYPTKYFTEETGLETLPKDLQHSLSKMGFYYDEKTRSYYYRNPSEEAVPDAFKGQTMGTVLNTIKQSYSSL